jgi:glycosyltransferase involved in cell wall biosynthesis
MVTGKKVLFVLHLPDPVHGSSIVGQYIRDSKIINANFDTAFINLSTSKTLDEIGKNPIVKISRYIRIVLKVINNLIRHEPEIVYLAITAKGVGFYKDMLIAMLAKIFGKKLVLHYHNKGVSLKQHLLFYDFMYRCLFKNTRVILLSKRLYYDIEKYVDKTKVFYCPNGIPYSNFEYKMSSIIITDKVPKLFFLSNLIESKGVYVLLEALKILNAIGVKFECNFVGGEGDISGAMLNSKISDYNLGHCVSYLGKKYNDHKYEAFLKSDIFVLPSHYHNECFPLVLLEAMMFRLPIISTSEGAIPDLVQDGETGFVVRKQDPEHLAKKILILINNPSLRKLMGQNGYEKFRINYTLEIFEMRLTKILAGF